MRYKVLNVEKGYYEWNELPVSVTRECGPWKSQTVPDDTLTIREILERYGRDSAWLDDQKRRAFNSLQEGIDHEAVDALRLSQSDLVDRQEFRDQVRGDIRDYERSVKRLQQSDPKVGVKKKVVKKPLKKPVKGKPKAADEENE